MTETVNNMENDLLKELRLIRQDLKYIKTHMVDQDMVLTHEEKSLLDESRHELQAGRTRTLDEIIRSRNAS
jgi:hypothetical protein